MEQMTCKECGAEIDQDLTCQDAFYQFLYWENEGDEEDKLVHHLMVLCYHMQHPSMLSANWLTQAKNMLKEFIIDGVTPEEMRSKITDHVNSSTRPWKIKSTPNNFGTYEHPIHWKMTTLDVLFKQVDNYPKSIYEWAHSILDNLRISGNIE